MPPGFAGPQPLRSDREALFFSLAVTIERGTLTQGFVILRGLATPLIRVRRLPGRLGRPALTWRISEHDSATQFMPRWCGCSRHRGVAVHTKPVPGQSLTFITTSRCAAGLARSVLKILDVVTDSIEDVTIRVATGDLELRYATALIQPASISSRSSPHQPLHSFGPRMIGGIADCRVCGRPLNNEESVARGMGPVCFERHHS